MTLLDKESNIEFEAEIIEIDENEIKSIDKSKRFDFAWSKESSFSVFKIVEKDTTEALGLMSLVDFSEEYRIHINLIENANENKGSNKKIDKVAGCLLAFAARIAFDRGYLGFTSLVPKTELIEIYVNKYGFKQFGRQLALDRMEAIDIMNKYL